MLSTYRRDLTQDFNVILKASYQLCQFDEFLVAMINYLPAQNKNDLQWFEHFVKTHQLLSIWGESEENKYFYFPQDWVGLGSSSDWDGGEICLFNLISVNICPN